MTRKLLTALIGLGVASAMLYFPYAWCRWRQEGERDWGLAWFMGPGAWRDVFGALFLTLAPLTVVSLHWPAPWGGPGPHHPPLLQALDSLGGGVAAAFIEETFFRGWLQTLLSRRLGAGLALFLTALVFALSHLIVLPGPLTALSFCLRTATFFPGLVMGLLRLRNGSILPGILYHAACNVWAVWWAPIPY